MILSICAATFLFTLLGGLFALKFQKYRALIFAFCAGAMIGVALFDLVPTALELSRQKFSSRFISGTAAFGFIFYLVAERFFENWRSKKVSILSLSKPSLLIAGLLTIHSFLDGIAIGLAFQVSSSVGIVVAVAVIIHDLADGMNTANVVTDADLKRSAVIKWILLNASAPILGAFSTYFYRFPPTILGVLLAFMSGCFIYIGAVEFLPKSRKSNNLVVSTLLTIGGLIVLFVAIHFSGS